ncbi:MAG: hypothetical protein MJK14_29615 [Rivularia sp. ALOHA_DT_140]|nr:hypothetical protein [Rivularia sp. ALOHA_DT_140]
MKLLIQVASILSGTGAIDVLMIEGFVNLFNHKDTNQYLKVASAANNFFKGNLPGLSKVITSMSQNRREQTLQFVKNEQSALAHAIGVFHEFKEELEEMFTDSTLV